MPESALTNVRSLRVAYALLFLYATIAGIYESANSVASVIGNFNLRDQVQAPFQLYGNLIESSEGPAVQAGVERGDTVLAINNVPFTGQAMWQRVRWYAHPGDIVTLRIRKQNGITSTARMTLAGYPKGWSVQDPAIPTTVLDAVFSLVVILVVPLFCLVLGVWVGIAKPLDPNAWFILILLTYPQGLNPGAYRWWVPDFLALRLYWHLFIQFLVPAALFLLGLLFPDRSRLDKTVPWLKWVVIAFTAVMLVCAFVSEYNAWYDIFLLPRVDTIDRLINPVFVWSSIMYVGLYWVLLFDQLRAASSPDARRRLQVLLAGSMMGLGSLLLIFGLLPYLGIADPNENRSLLLLGLVLMLFFPLSLAYVVIVQRAMDVRILLRMGSKYVLANATLMALRVAASVAFLWLLAIPFLSHAQSALATGLWTTLLLLAGLVVRKKSPAAVLQHWVDRKFFREAYDAEVMLNQLARTAQTISEPATLIETISHRISDVLHVDQITVMLCCNGQFQPAYAIGPVLEWPASELEKVRALKPVFNGLNDGRVPDASQPELLLPLPGRTQLLGALALGPKRSEAPYTPTDLRLLESVSVQTGLGLELSQTAASLAEAAVQQAHIARELEVAREVQERLFPQKLPQIASMDLAGACRTVFGVGGDYYDAFSIGEGCLGLAIGDVSGKGISAALLMSSLRACLRTLTHTTSGELTQLMSHLNRLIYEASAVNRYATFFFGIFDPSTGKFEYVNAGHNPPVLIRYPIEGETGFVRLDCGGPVVGLLPEARYEQGSVFINPGDLLLTYTDGISEAMNPADDEWGEEAMIESAQKAFHLSADEVVKAIFAAADIFAETAPQHDDMTVLVMRRSFSM